MANEKGLTKAGTADIAKPTEVDMSALFKSMGISGDEAQGFEQTQSGGVTRWLNLKAFMADPSAPQNKAVKGNGKAFGGLLLGRQDIEVDDDQSGELNADGQKVRYFYTLKLISPCPVTHKDDSGQTVETIAEKGDIIAIGERFSLRKWRELCDNGGLYAVVVQPHSRINVGGGHTMWTFATWEKELRRPMKVKAELVKTPF